MWRIASLSILIGLMSSALVRADGSGDVVWPDAASGMSWCLTDGSNGNDTATDVAVKALFNRVLVGCVSLTAIAERVAAGGSGGGSGGSGCDVAPSVAQLAAVQSTALSLPRGGNSTRYSRCITACSASTAGTDNAGGAMVVGLWRNACYCFVSSFSTSPPSTVSMTDCCGVPSATIPDVAASGHNAVGNAMVLVSVSNRCAANSGCRENGCAGRAFEYANHSDGNTSTTVETLEGYCCTAGGVDDTEVLSSDFVRVLASVATGIAIFVLVAGLIWRCQGCCSSGRTGTGDEGNMELGNIIETTADSPRGVRIRDDDEASSLTAVLMFGVRRETVGCGDEERDVFNVDDTAAMVSKAAQDQGDDCAVCLSAFVPGTSVSVLPCGHRLHSPCLVDFIRYHIRRYQELNCPLCRASILAQPREAAASARVAIEREEDEQRSQAAAPTGSARHSRPADDDDDGAAVATPARTTRRASDGDTPTARRANPFDSSTPARPMPPPTPTAGAAKPLLVLPRYPSPPDGDGDGL
jgi:hypothetical protein